MKLAIAIATYRRSDGSTPKFVTRALESVKAQTHQDFKVFLIGDDYDNQKEFDEFGGMFSSDQIYKKNLKVAKERSKYSMGSRELWCSGGANAFNILIDEILSQGYDYICHLDDDDYWSADHLELINQVICSRNDVACVYTCSTYLSGSITQMDGSKVLYLPRLEPSPDVLDAVAYFAYPKPGNVVHSSTCVNYRKVLLRYRDVYAETGQLLEGDVDMWLRLTDFCKTHALTSYVITKITCFHDTENCQ